MLALYLSSLRRGQIIGAAYVKSFDSIMLSRTMNNKNIFEHYYNHIFGRLNFYFKKLNVVIKLNNTVRVMTPSL